MGAINTWTFEAVAAVNFHVEMELDWLIHKGDLTEKDGVPEDLIKDIKSMELCSPFDFTAYKKTGSPTHPFFPAMHSAGSTCKPLVAGALQALTEIIPSGFSCGLCPRIWLHSC